MYNVLQQFIVCDLSLGMKLLYTINNSEQIIIINIKEKKTTFQPVLNTNSYDCISLIPQLVEVSTQETQYN